jgi:hypothetical protein
MAAHMLGVMEASPDEKLRWHVEALERAKRVGDERAAGFYPSQYASVGAMYRQLGRVDEAIVFSRKADLHVGILHDEASGKRLKEELTAAIAELSRRAG